MALVLSFVLGTLYVVLFLVSTEVPSLASGQELLPEAGSNETIGEPYANTTGTIDNPEPLPDSPLAPLFN